MRREFLTVNPAREKGLRLKEQRTRGNILEVDELEDLLAAAAEIDQRATPEYSSEGQGACAPRLRTDMGPSRPAPRRRRSHRDLLLRAVASTNPSGRRAILACLAGAGLRNTELCLVDVLDVDFVHGLINVADAKTEAGIRKVDLSPMLHQDLLAWSCALPSPPPDSPFFPTRAGTRRDKDNINAHVLRPAIRRANQRRTARNLPPLPPRVTAHTLRRTYISMMFAAGAELPYVMAQVGHDDSKVTLEIYARILKRRDRDQIGRAFDALLIGGGPNGPKRS